MATPIRITGFAPFDRSARVRWTALELGLPVEDNVIKYQDGVHKSAEYRSKHPFCTVPLAEVEGQARWDSVAICQSLIEEHTSEGLAPPIHAPDRPLYLSWLFFIASSFDAKVGNVLLHGYLRPNEEERVAALKSATPMLDDLQSWLSTRDYLLGERFSLADIILGHNLQLLVLSRALDGHPGLQAYLARLAARPAALASGLFAKAG